MKIGIASADYLRADKNPDGTEAWGGSGWARVGQYIDYYRAAGHEVAAGVLWQRDGRFYIERADLSVLEPDIIIMQRLMHDGIAATIKTAKAGGQVIINDLDDWYWGLDPSNLAFNASHPKNSPTENTNFYASVLSSSSVLTVSTPYLAERMRNRVKCPVVVIPNYIDVNRFTPVQQSLGTPTFGWAGSTGHRSGDLETVAGVLRRPITDKTINFQHSGEHPSGTPMHELLGVPKVSVATLPLTIAQNYPSLLNFDVGIVPLRDTPFNMAKSDIKGLEYSASGIPFIAQDLPSYKQLHKEWNGAFWLADRPKDWVTGMKKMMDYSYRCERQQELLELVKGRDIAYGAGEWLDFLDSVK